MLLALELLIFGFIIGYIIRKIIYKKKPDKLIKNSTAFIIAIPAVLGFISLGVLAEDKYAGVSAWFSTIGLWVALKLKNPDIITNKWLLWILIIVFLSIEYGRLSLWE